VVLTLPNLPNTTGIMRQQQAATSSSTYSTSDVSMKNRGEWTMSIYYVLFYLGIFDIAISLLILLFPELLSAINLTCAYKTNKFINPIGIRMFGILLFIIAVFIITGLISLYSKLRNNSLHDGDPTTYMYLHLIFQVTATKNAVFFLYITITLIEHAISEVFIEQTIPIAISMWIFFGVLAFHCVLLIISWAMSRHVLLLLRKNSEKPEYPNNSNTNNNQARSYVYFNKT
jgi:magnesium-transporting ATPase (P-type)